LLLENREEKKNEMKKAHMDISEKKQKNIWFFVLI
jgi:hypothetical protein